MPLQAATPVNPAGAAALPGRVWGNLPDMLKRSYFDLSGLRGQRLRKLLQQGSQSLAAGAILESDWDSWTLPETGIAGRDARRLALAMEVLHAWVFYLARASDVREAQERVPVLELTISEDTIARCQEPDFSEMGGEDLLMFPHSTSFAVLRTAEGPTHYAGVPHFIAIVRGDPGSLGPGITDDNLPEVRPWRRSRAEG
jgi:hypothetical protein